SSSDSLYDPRLPITHDPNSSQGEIHLREDREQELKKEDVLGGGLGWKESSHQQKACVSAADSDYKGFDSQIDRQLERSSRSQVDSLRVLRV
ncbi:hypothetical protein PMAYCL1PPCAC_32955, partial [Pristionchus mayeri]